MKVVCYSPSYVGPYLEKIVPKDLRPRAVHKTVSTVFPNMDRPRLVNNISIFKPKQIIAKRNLHKLNNFQQVARTENRGNSFYRERLHRKFFICVKMKVIAKVCNICLNLTPIRERVGKLKVHVNCRMNNSTGLANKLELDDYQDDFSSKTVIVILQKFILTSIDD